MPNAFVVPEQVARLGIALVTKDFTLSSTFNRDFEDNFGGGRGDVVNVRKPAVLTARSKELRTREAVELDSLNETKTDVKLTHMVYSAVPVSDEELSLDIASFGAQVLKPQTDAIVEDLEERAVATMQSVAETLTIPYAVATPGATFTRARKMLRDMGLPQSGLTAAVGTQVYADMVEAGEFKDASQSGSTEALRNANVQRAKGFDVIESNRLDEDELVFYIRGVSFTMAVRAPVVPAGVAFGASASENGFALRWVRDYDSTYLEDRSIVSTFVGTKVMPVVRRHPTTPNTIQEITPVIRVKTSTIPA